MKEGKTKSNTKNISTIDRRLVSPPPAAIVNSLKSEYTYKNHFYKIHDEVSFKHPDTREWISGVIYQQRGSGLLFVREKEEFFKLFKLV